jgi:transcriptional antiterminator NusG
MESTVESEKEWFIVHTLSGSERKAKKLLEEEIKSSGLDEKFGEILIPTENVSRIRGGKRQIVERQLYPGYILIQMEMSEDTIRLVTQTPGVMSFLGSRLKPQSLREEEVKRILTAVETEKGTVSSEIPFKRGESVKVAEGPFTDFTGVVEELYPSRGKLKVMVTIFGRATPVELDFTQVKPI